MNRPGKVPGRPWLQIALLAVLFAGPLIGAAWLYYGGEALRPSGGTNHGALLEPIVNLDDATANTAWNDAARDHWVLVYLDEGPCEDACRDALYTLRQSRLMLGEDMNRLRRVFLHGESPPDRVFIEEQHRGLVTIRDRSLSRQLAETRPSQLAPGGYFLADPLGNLVMYFPPDIVPGDMVDDIEHLLKLSRIG